MTVLSWPPADNWPRLDGNGPWAGVTHQDLEEVAASVRPLRRLLLLMGYDVPSLAIQLSGQSHAAVMDLATPAVLEEVLAPTGPGDEWSQGAIVRLPLSGFGATELSSSETAIPLPLLLDATLAESVTIQADLANLAQSYLYVTAALPSGTFFSFEQLTSDLHRHSIEELSDVELAPDSGAGLLWIVDPSTWFESDVEQTTSARLRELVEVAEIAREVVQNTLGSTGDPIANFLTEQFTLEAMERPASVFPFFRRRKSPTLKQLLRWADGETHRAARRADTFFGALEAWLDQRGQGGVYTAEELGELADRAWFEVLVGLINRGVLAPPALPPSLGLGQLEMSAPVAARRVDVHTVDLDVRNQLTVTLTVVRDEAGLELAPDELGDNDGSVLSPIRAFTWDYLTPPDPAELPTLVIVAAPGVDILIPTAPHPVGWRPLVIRVPAVSLVPEWGSAVRPTDLLAPHTIGPDDGWEVILPGQPPAAPVTQVVPKADGMALVYPMYANSEGQDLVAVDITLGPDALHSPHERFAFDVVYYRDRRGTPLPDPTAHISIWATEGVDIKVVTTALTEMQDHRLETEVWRVSDPSDIPALGVPLPFDESEVEGFLEFPDGWIRPWTSDEGGMPARQFTRDASVEVMQVGLTAWFTFVVDVIVGAIPLVGDVVDISDFFLALGTGKDKWGQPVTRFDLFLMGGGALLPFVSGSLAEGMGNAIQALPTPSTKPHVAPLRSGAAQRSVVPVASAAPVRGVGFEELVHRARRPSNLSVAEAADVASQAKRWNGLSQVDKQVVASRLLSFAVDYARRFGDDLKGQFLLIDDLLDETQQNFRHWFLRMEFEEWRAINLFGWDGTPPMPDLSIAEFVRVPPNRVVRTLLQVLIGDDVVGAAQAFRRPAAAAALWPSTARLAFRRNAPSRGWLDEFLDGRHPEVAPMATHIANSIEHRRGLWNGPAPIWTDQSFLRLPGNAGWPDAVDYVRRINLLLAAGTTALLGSTRSYHPDEFAELLVTSIDIVAHEMAVAGRTLDDVLPLDGATQRVTGVEGFVRRLMASNGYEHGARYELRMAALDLQDAEPANNLFLRLGAMLPGVSDDALRDGPDLLRYIGRSPTVADILQGKAYRTLRPLATDVAPTTWWANGAWRGPEIFRQTMSDILRMANQPDRFMIEGFTEASGDVRFTGNFEIWIDRTYFFSSPADPDVAALAAIAARLGVDPGTVLSMQTTDLAAQLNADELCVVLDHIKMAFDNPSLERIDDIARVITEGLGEQLSSFLNPSAPNPPPSANQILGSTLGITIPDEIRFDVEVLFR